MLAEDSRYTDAAVGEWTDGLLKAQFHYAIHVVDLVCDQVTDLVCDLVADL